MFLCSYEHSWGLFWATVKPLAKNLILLGLALKMPQAGGSRAQVRNGIPLCRGRSILNVLSRVLWTRGFSSPAGGKRQCPRPSEHWPVFSNPTGWSFPGLSSSSSHELVSTQPRVRRGPSPGVSSCLCPLPSVLHSEGLQSLPHLFLSRGCFKAGLTPFLPSKGGWLLVLKAIISYSLSTFLLSQGKRCIQPLWLISRGPEAEVGKQCPSGVWT